MRPMQEWLDHPDNQAQYLRIVDDVHQEMREGKHRVPGSPLNPRQIDPDSMERELNSRKSALTEQLIAEAPDEYLDEWDLQMRRERYADPDEEDLEEPPHDWDIEIANRLAQWGMAVADLKRK